MTSWLRRLDNVSSTGVIAEIDKPGGKTSAPRHHLAAAHPTRHWTQPGTSLYHILCPKYDPHTSTDLSGAYPAPVRRLADPSPAAIEAAAVTLVAAFDNPTTRACNGDTSEGIDIVRQRATLTEAIIDSRMEVLVIEEGQDVAALVFIIPPEFKRRPADPLAPHNVALAALVTPELEAVGKKLDTALAQLKLDTFGPAVNEMYSIGRLATSPAHQRKGLGRILLDVILDRARNENRDIALVTPTPDVRDWYLRMGFHVHGKLDIELRGTDTTWWAMSTRAKI